MGLGAGDRALIYGLSRDTAALSCALAREGVQVHIVHPDKAPCSLRDLVGGLNQAIRVSECWQRDADVDCDALFVDASYQAILPPHKLSCAIAAERADVPVLSVADYVFERAPGLTVGVTGSGGKTTTASLIAHILGAAGRTVAIATDPLPQTNRCPNYEVIDAVAKLGTSDVVVAELTSVYLSFTRTSPDVAVVTNLWPDHLEWHGSMEAYVAAKQNILRCQSAHGWAVLNRDDELVREHFAALVRGRSVLFGLRDRGDPYAVFVANGTLTVRWGGEVRALLPVDRVPIETPFVGNVLGAVAAALAAGAEPDTLANALITFAGVPQRRELVGEIGGIRVVNDGMAGSPVKVRRGLEAFVDASVILVAGGHASFPTEVLHSSPEAQTQLEALAETIGSKAAAVVLFGEGGELLRDRLGRHGYSNAALASADDLEDAERKASRLARPGNVIVFAPTYHVPREKRESFGAVALAELRRTRVVGG